MKKLIILSTAAVLTAAAAFAQTATPGVDARQARQEQRIQNGEANGSLTPHEAGKLEAQQTRIQDKEATAKADGKVTPKERRSLQRSENRASKNIHAKKHNARTAS